MAATGRYTVRRGDTLSSIAMRQNLSVSAIAEANGVTNPDRIFVGQVLSIPDPSAKPGPAAMAGIVVVQPGETVTRVSARTGVPAATIIAANGLVKPYHLYTGGQLLLTGRNSTATVPLRRCPVAGARFMNDWGFPRADTGFHEGSDLMAERGAPVVAPVSGVVTHRVGTIGGNAFLLVGADGTTYYGAHMKSFGKSGKVKAGDVLGMVGNTGDAAGGPTHLHFEIHPGGGAAVNPYQYLVAACR
jgi:murein DD-endopeptidase MepM/ murein hydrolase activator NlpD